MSNQHVKENEQVETRKDTSASSLSPIGVVPHRLYLTSSEDDNTILAYVYEHTMYGTFFSTHLLSHLNVIDVESDTDVRLDSIDFNTLYLASGNVKVYQNSKYSFLYQALITLNEKDTQAIYTCSFPALLDLLSKVSSISYMMLSHYA